MISCNVFRETFSPATADAALLEHLRTCDACLEFAAGVDPEAMFRALGGGQLLPPGGLDAFVDDVMQQVRVRQTEHTLAPHHAGRWMSRLAVAASLSAAVISGTLFYGHRPPSSATSVASVGTQRAVPAAQLTTKPIVDTYDSATATIVEVPSEGANDVKVVMVFDETLPADL